MAEPTVTVDPRIYGGEAPTGNPVPEFDPAGSALAAGPVQAPERVPSAEIGANTESAAVGQNTAALNAREANSIGDSVNAATASWSPVRVWDYINAPQFDKATNFDVKPYINSVPFVMSEDEQKFLAKSQSPDEFNYRLQNTKDQRDLYQKMGDHPLVSTLVGMADPGYLALDLASFGLASGATAVGAGLGTARAIGGIAAATSTYGLGMTQAQVVPMSDTEVILPALLSGAAGAAFYRPGHGVVPHDTSYPVEDLTRATGEIAGQSSGVEQRVVAEQRQVAQATPTVAQDTERIAASTDPSVQPSAVQGEPNVATAATQPAVAPVAQPAVAPELAALEPPPADLSTTPSFTARVGGDLPGGVKATDHQTDAYQFLAQYENDAKFGPMIRTLRAEQPDLLNQLKVYESPDLERGGRAFYAGGTHSVHLPTEEGLVARGLGDNVPRYTGPFVALHEVMHGLTVHKLQYGLRNPGTAHGKIVAQLADIYDASRAAYKTTPRVADEIAKDTKLQYFHKNLNEFVAGLYSGEEGGLPQHLARLPSQVPGQPNMLSRMVDTVRKLLGVPPMQRSALTDALGLTDDLINTKLNVRVAGNDIVPGMDLNSAPPSTTASPFGKAPTGTPEQQAQTVISKMESAAAKTGNAIQWSLHKTMSKISTAGKKVADLLMDDPVNMTKDSVVSQKSAIRSDLAQLQYKYEDALKEEMANRGAGIYNRLRHPIDSAATQRQIEKEVYAELARRDNAIRIGGNINDPATPAWLRTAADAHDAATALGGREMKAAGVTGADAFDVHAGYATRKWSVTQIESAEDRMMASGMTQKQAKQSTVKLVGNAIQRANPDWEPQVIHDVSAAIIERARRKGYFEDQALRGHAGDAAAKEIRDILNSSGASQDRINKAMEVVTGVNDEAGKASTLKHRVPMDITTSTRLANGSDVSVMDLLDTNVARNLDTYLDGAAGNSALARKGLVTTTDIANLRTEFLHGIESESKRREGAALFDNTIASIKGQPTGEEVSDGMRKLAAVTQMVGLSSSGLWQVTEYANAMAKYGLLKTTKEIMRTMPVFRSLMTNPNAEGGAENLAQILSRNSAQDLRLRPYIQKMEDNFEMSVGDNAMMLAQQAKQLVPYINAMHYIHHNQARVVGNLVADLFQQGAEGSATARAALAKYGLEGQTLDSIASDVKAHGLNTAGWSDATWAQVRGPLSKMMDDAVLKNRTGEIPAFAQFSSVGKFIFTFRSFVLGAHNKVLAGSLGREGFGGIGLLMAYQFPLTMLATQANNALKGQPQTDLKQTAVLALQQMGAMGLFSDLWGIASGSKQQFGSSGLMAIDRLYKTGSALATGNFGTAASGAVNSIPLLSILPGVKAMAETLKDDPKSDKKPK